jgi:hypothetical protein
VQGLQDKIKLVAIDLLDKPAWYKEKIYPQGTVHFHHLYLPPISSYSTDAIFLFM